MCMSYESQRSDAGTRAIHRARKILVELGGTGDLDEIDCVPKPKWMRWRTFDRRIQAARDANSESLIHALSRF